MSDLETWPETGMTNSIVCIWANESDIVTYIDEYNSDRSGPVDFIDSDDKLIMRVDHAMVAWRYHFTSDWHVRPDIRTLVNCTYEIKQWSNQ